MLTIATDVLDEPHVTELVMSWLFVPTKLPMARNCTVPPLLIMGLIGLNEIDARVGGTTVKFEPEEAVTPLTATVMGPVVAPGGTVTVRLVAVAALTAARMPLN